MKKYLVFDTETTGLFPYDIPLSADVLNLYPRIVSISWEVISANSVGSFLLQSRSYIIKPDAYKIPPAATEIHGITDEFARENGVPILGVLMEFMEVAQNVDYVAAHNYDFDSAVIDSEFLRAGIKWSALMCDSICTQKQATEITKIPARYGYGYKWPSLNELYRFFFTDNVTRAHTSDGDVTATVKSLCQIIKKYPQAIATPYKAAKNYPYDNA